MCRSRSRNARRSANPMASENGWVVVNVASLVAWTLVAIFSPWQVTVGLGSPIVVATAIVMVRRNEGLSEDFAWLKTLTGREG